MANGAIEMSVDPGPDDEVPPMPSGAMDQGALLADPRLFRRTCVEILKISGVGLTLLDGVHLYGRLG